MTSTSNRMRSSKARCDVCFSQQPTDIFYYKTTGGRRSSEVESKKGDFVETKRYWTLPERCCSLSSEWEERKKSRAGSGSLCEPRKSRKTVAPTFDCWVLSVVFSSLCG